VREGVAFALGAIIGDITRFSEPRKLVKYIGLNPAFDDSGEGEWHGGISGHGRKDLRALLIESAHAILRSPQQPLGKWGRKLFARKGVRNIAVAAVARKLAVAVWYLMMGRWNPLEEIDAALSLKVGKIISQVGKDHLKQTSKTRQTLRQEIFQTLLAGRVKAPDPLPKTASAPAHETKPSSQTVKVYRLKPAQKLIPKGRTPHASTRLMKQVER
jgi:hypothetical protein